MTDKMTIIGKDGKPRYEVIGERVEDLRRCACEKPQVVQLSAIVGDDDDPKKKKWEQKINVCTACGYLIDLSEPTQEN